MCTIRVRDIVGNSGLSKTNGDKLYSHLMDTIRDNGKAKLDFSGVETFASLFFNASVGRLLKNYSKSDLNKILKIENINPDGSKVLKRSIDNSSEYFNNPKLRAAINQAVSSYREEDK